MFVLGTKLGGWLMAGDGRTVVVEISLRDGSLVGGGGRLLASGLGLGVVP